MQTVGVGSEGVRIRGPRHRGTCPDDDEVSEHAHTESNYISFACESPSGTLLPTTSSFAGLIVPWLVTRC